MNKPIKRAVSIQAFSRDHHHGLVLCWKIRKGVNAGVDGLRIKNYVNWFFENHLVPHFDSEEKYLFPVLGGIHEMTARAINEHERLRSLYESDDYTYKTLNDFADLLEAHIRFEEREMFNEIQEKITPDQLKILAQSHHEEPFCDNETDAFWL